MPGSVTFDLRGDLALLTIERERRRNALTRKLCRDLRARLQQACGDPRVRALVLTGKGVAFCAGADLDELRAAMGEPGAMSRLLRDVQGITPAMHACEKPLIAAINGTAVGMGLELSLGADWRIAVEGATFALPERRNRVEVTNAASWLLPRLAGAAAAEELLASGRTFDTAEARRLGLIDEVVAPGDLLATAAARGREGGLRGTMRSLTARELQGILAEESARISSCLDRSRPSS